MIDEDKLKNIRIFHTTAGFEVIGYVVRRTLRGVYIEAPTRIENDYFNYEGPLQGFFPYGANEPLEAVLFMNHGLLSESTPRPEIVEMWIDYAFNPLDEVEPITEENGLSLA